MTADYHFEDESMQQPYDSTLMKRLLTYLRPHVKRLVLCSVLLLLATVVNILNPYITMQIIDNCLGGLEGVPTEVSAQDTAERMGTLKYLVAVMIVISILEAGFSYSLLLVLTFVGQRMLLTMRLEIFSHLQKMSTSFLDRNPVGRLLTRVTNDVENIQQAIVSGMVYSIGEFLSIVLALVVMFWLNWKLTLIVLVAVPFVLLASYIFRKFVRLSYQEVRRKIAALNAFTQENVSGAKIVQLFGNEDKEFARYSKLNGDVRDEWFRQVIYHATYFPVAEILGAVTTACIILVGGLQVLDSLGTGSDEATIGMIYLYMQWGNRLFGPIRALTERYNQLQAAMASSERIFQLLDTPPDIVDGPDPHVSEKLEGHIEFKNVSFAYEASDWVLKDISFHVAPGEHVAIVGHTGAGKSTIAGLLSRFYDIQKGSITIDGVDIRDYELSTLRKNTGIVQQDVYLFSGSVDSNIRLGDATMSDEYVRECANYVNAARFIEALPEKYDYEVGERGGNLSTGQRQLLAFARTLAHDPSILILDEATSSVDTETEALIQDAVVKLMEHQTSIVIAHRLSTVQHADRIIVLHHGEVREIGTHQELLAHRGLYYTLYQLQYKDQLPD
jgi:ATP-binding cassette subfamily B protein